MTFAVGPSILLSPLRRPRTTLRTILLGKRKPQLIARSEKTPKAEIGLFGYIIERNKMTFILYVYCLYTQRY